MEATAKLVEHKIKNKTVKFMVDSQSAIKALTNFTTKDSLVLQCKLNLNRLGEANTVTLQWIPGHEGHMGNEVADRLAKRGAARSDTCGPLPLLPVPKAHTKRLIKEWGHKKHKEEWTTRKDCRQTKMFGTISTKPLQKILTSRS